MKRLGVFLLVLGATTLFDRADLSSVDEGFIFKTTGALVERGSWQMDELLSGRRYSRFSPLPSLFAAPFYAVSTKFLDAPARVGMPQMKDWLLFSCGLASCVLTAWTAVAFFGFLRTLQFSDDAAVCGSLLWAFGTLAFPYSSSLFHQVTATLLMVYVCRFAFGGNVVGTMAATALLVSVQSTLALTALPLCLREKGRWDRRTLIGLGTGVAAGFGLHVATNTLRGDHWFIGAYQTETFTTPTFVGTVGIFFSSGKGLLWFAPLAFVGLLMLVPFASRRPEVGRPLLFAVVCHCLVVIHWWAWHGSLSWGPRLLLPLLPLMLVPIADLIERRAELAAWQARGLGSIAAVSVVVNIWAATQPMIGFLSQIPDAALSEWTFIPSLTPLTHWLRPVAFVGRFEELTRAGQFLVGAAVGGFLVGGWMLSKKPLIRTELRDGAPWRALALIAVAFVPYFFEPLPVKIEPQRRFLGESTTGGGELHYPVRGEYRLERDRVDRGEIVVGNRRLDSAVRNTLVEAPPMTAAVRFGSSADLVWTIPGEGQYRVPVPAEYLYSRASASLAPWLVAFRQYSWLLYLLAVPLFFDWLLGGRRMKEATEEGREANA